jgi:hypothetical protein
MVQYKIPPKASLVRFDEASLPGKGPVTPPGGGKASMGWSDANFSQESGKRRRRALPKPRVSLKPPHTKFAVIPSRAVTDPRINTRKPLLLLLAAIGIHASIHGICYPSQRRLAMLCGKSPSWAGKYLRELISMGYVRRLVPPTYRGPRAAWRLQVMWSKTQPLPSAETSVWVWQSPLPRHALESCRKYQDA